MIYSYSSNTVMHIIYVKALVVRRQGSGCFAESKCRRMTSSRWWQSVTRPAPPAPAMSCIVLQSSRHLIHLSTICPSLCPSVTGGSCMFLHATHKTDRARVSSLHHTNKADQSSDIAVFSLVLSPIMPTLTDCSPSLELLLWSLAWCFIHYR